MDNKKESMIDITTGLGGSAVGATVGAFIGTVIAGPAGSVGGAVAGKAIEMTLDKIGSEIKERCLSRSENRKITSVYDAAKLKIQLNINEGRALRTDDFFDSNTDNRSSAEEVLEGTLFTAQREYEEKKLIYLANLYANINFDNTVSGPMANQLLKIAADITYRQMVILSIIGKCNYRELNLPLRDQAFIGFGNYHDMSIAAEVFDLYRMSLLISSSAILDAASFTPSHLVLNGMGELLYRYMELSSIPENEMALEIVAFLTDSSMKKFAENVVTAQLPIKEAVEEVMSEKTLKTEEIESLFIDDIKSMGDKMQKLEAVVNNIPRISIEESDDTEPVRIIINEQDYVNEKKVAKTLSEI